MLQATAITPNTLAAKPARRCLHPMVGRLSTKATTFVRVVRRMIRATYSYLAISVALGILLFAAASQARNYGQYGNLSPAVRTWIESLTDNLHVPCCAIADGSVPEAWEMQKDHYRVKIYGEWLVVPDMAVIKGPNRLGHAVVWVDESEDMLGVRCFLPGPQS